MRSGTEAAEVAVRRREGALERASDLWGRLGHFGALAFVVILYANPAYWVPGMSGVGWVRFGLGSAALCAGAAVMHRITSGERLRTGGPGSLWLFAYAAVAALSYFWAIDRAATLGGILDVAKLLVIYVAIQNALDSPRRLRRFLQVAALASLAPAVGAIRTWITNDNLIDGTRTHWLGIYADPNRLAMSLVAVVPFALVAAARARRLAVRLLFSAVALLQIAAVVLAQSRSGSIALGLAVLLFLLRGRGSAPLKGLLVASMLLVGVALLAPSTFWQRNRTIVEYREDPSVVGRQHAWQVLGAIVADRPLGGVGVAGFIHAWDRYAPLEAGGHRLVAHNMFMETLGELGAPAVLFLFSFMVWLCWRLWRAGADKLLGPEARAIMAGLAGYVVCELVNGYALSWFLYLLFACGVAAVRLARFRLVLASEGAEP